MTRTMWDGVRTDAAVIAKHARPGDLVMYYIDGDFAWATYEISLIPAGVGHVTITVLGGHAAADVCDCEYGDLTPASAAAWVRYRRSQGYARPTVYTSLSGMPAIRQATGNLILARDYDAITADYDDSTAPVYPLAAAKQYLNTASYDVSAVYDPGWPHRTTAATIPAVKPSAVWPAGVVLRSGGSGGAVRALQQAFRDSGIYGVRGIAVDGVYGVQTHTACENFEAAEHLTIDGIAGPQVRAKLIALGRMTAAGVAVG